jgi:hypothetical protein
VYASSHGLKEDSVARFRASFEREVLPSGKIRVRTTVGYGANGKQIKRQSTWPRNTAAAAIKAWVLQAKSEFSQGTVLTPQTTKVTDLSEQWLAIKQSDLSASTHKKYVEMTHGRLLKTLGHVRVQDVHVSDLQMG